MLARDFDPAEKPAENAVLEAVANVAVGHLRSAAREAAGKTSHQDHEPILIQVDGPGRTQFLKKLSEKLDPTRSADSAAGDSGAPPWTAIWFDAWRYQRVAPPWWWLMSALDKQLRERARRIGRVAWARQRAQDYRGRLRRLGRDLLWVVPGALLLVCGWALWDDSMWSIVKWVFTAGGGIAALYALVASIGNALRRHLLAQSPRGASALLRRSDPMEDLLRRYAFLVRSGGQPVVVLIDNLDRCRAEYVVEMLEGIQTLLRDPHAPKRWSSPWSKPVPPCPFVAFVVAADREWICDSYLHVYKEFEASAREPGRPFGLVFVEKIFDVALRIPTVPAAAAQRASAHANGKHTPSPFYDCANELQVRKRLRKREHKQKDRNGDAPHPRPELRCHAVKRLAEIELEAEACRRRQCSDTAKCLDELLAELEPGPAVQRQLDVAYCVKRTTQLLAGHDVDHDRDAVYRLGLWTILELRWPFLVEHLSRHPGDVEHLVYETAPDGVDVDLKHAFAHPVARSVVNGFRVRLTADDIVRFTTPVKYPTKTTRTTPRERAQMHSNGKQPVA